MLIVMTNLTHPDNIVSRQHHVQYVQAWRKLFLLLYKFTFTCLCCKIILCLICIISLMLPAFRLNIVFSSVISNYVHSIVSFFLCFFHYWHFPLNETDNCVLISDCVCAFHCLIFFFFHYGRFSLYQTENDVLISDCVSAFHCQFFALTVVFCLVLHLGI